MCISTSHETFCLQQRIIKHFNKGMRAIKSVFSYEIHVYLKYIFLNEKKIINGWSIPQAHSDTHILFHYMTEK